MGLDENIIANHGYDKQWGYKWVASLHDHRCTLCRCVEFGPTWLHVQGRDKGKHTSAQAAHELTTSVGFLHIGSGYFEPRSSMPVGKWLDIQHSTPLVCCVIDVNWPKKDCLQVLDLWSQASL